MNDHEGRTFDLETCKTNMSAGNDVNKRHFGRKMSLMRPVSNDLSKIYCYKWVKHPRKLIFPQLQSSNDMFIENLSFGNR